MKTIVEIEWDTPEMQEWLCADNIAIALHAYCKNTRFKVIDLNAEVKRLVEALTKYSKAHCICCRRSEFELDRDITISVALDEFERTRGGRK